MVVSFTSTLLWIVSCSTGNLRTPGRIQLFCVKALRLGALRSKVGSDLGEFSVRLLFTVRPFLSDLLRSALMLMSIREKEWIVPSEIVFCSNEIAVRFTATRASSNYKHSKWRTASMARGKFSQELKRRWTVGRMTARRDIPSIRGSFYRGNLLWASTKMFGPFY